MHLCPRRKQDFGRATLSHRFTRTFNLRCARHRCRHRCQRALTPFSHPYLSAAPKGKEGRLFSSALICPRGQLPVRKRSALCCPDFPHAPPGRMRQTARLVSKISLLRGKFTIFIADKRQIRGKNVLLQDRSFIIFHFTILTNE